MSNDEASDEESGAVPLTLTATPEPPAPRGGSGRGGAWFSTSIVAAAVLCAAVAAARIGHAIADTLGARKSLTLTAHESAIIDCVVDPAAIPVTFNDIGALEETKRYLQESVVWPFNHPEMFPGVAASATLGVLLYGPPGTGKTMLAKAIARETNARFLEVKVESLFSKWVGESERLVSAVFTLARKLQPAIIFIDEMDALLGSRGGDGHVTYTHAKTIFLRHWDGLTANTTDQRLMVIGCTNRPGDLDDAILRRMPTKIKLGYPSQAERVAILRVILRESPTDLTEADLQGIAKGAAMFSGSDLKALCKEAKLNVIREAIRGRLHDGPAAAPAAVVQPETNPKACPSLLRSWLNGPDPPPPAAAAAPPPEPLRPVTLRDFQTAMLTVQSNERFVAEQRYGLQ